MNDIQVLAILAMVSMTIPATLAFLFWSERNSVMEQRDNLEINFRDMQRDMKFWKNLAVGTETDDYLDDWQTPDDLTQWNFGPRDKWGSSNA